MVNGTSEHLTEMQISSKSNRLSNATWPMALSTKASAVTPPYLARSSFSSEPPLTPMRMGMPFWRQMSATALTFSSPPMLPGLMRMASMPRWATSRAYL